MAQGVPKEKLQTYNCLEDQELRESIKEFRSVPLIERTSASFTNTVCLTSSEWPTIPQVYLKGEFIGGCDILLGMHQSGELTSVSLAGEVTL